MKLALDPYNNSTYQLKNHIRETLSYLDGKIEKGMTVVDIGQRSPLTDKIEERFGVKVINTVGDLDVDFKINYAVLADVVIYSHTIEHQFNPLYTLLKIKEFLRPLGKLYIMLPSRGKLLWDKGHYHEIDRYRMGLLLERAGYNITQVRRKKHWRHMLSYFTGIRMMLRMIFEYSICYTCNLNYIKR